MSNRTLVGSRIVLGLFPAALLVAFGLSGCGNGGPDASGADSSQDPASAFFRNRDTQPPSVPTDLSASAVSSAQVDLVWSAATDNREVTGYRVRRNGTLRAVLGNVTTYEDIGLSASTAYSYTVRAVDAAGNVSGNSNVASATTPASDTTPPTVSSTSPANAAIGIAVNSAITATFSEVMLKSTLTTGTFKLATQAGLPITGTVIATSNSATITPSTPLAAMTPHTATITTGTTDSAGNALAADFTWNFTTGAVPDTTPPMVSATSPANGASGVALNSSVSATFSEAMTNATLTTGSFTLAKTSDGTAVSGRVSVSGNTATFTPSAPLAGSIQYTATTTTGAQDAAGNALVANFVWTFTTAAAPDTTPPTVSAMSPANAATGVALNSPVSATFSEPMTNSTLTNASFTLAAPGGAAASGMVNVSGNTATFAPSAPLDAITQYTATITTAAKDAAGNALAANLSSTFTTAAVLDMTPPTVSATSPANAATGVALTSPVSATFSEAMTNATLSTASFTVATTSDGAAVVGTVSVSGNTATFTPSAPLAGSTQYTATITTVVADAAGNALAADFTWVFNTVPVTPPVPTVSLVASPTSVASGGSSTLNWSSTDATSCLASGAWSGSKAIPSSSQSSGVLTSTSTFTLACTGTGGTVMASATVTVTAPSTGSYTTSFPGAENPISEGGQWTNTVSATWNNPVSTVGGSPGHAVGLNSTGFNDSIAMLTGSFTADQKVTVTAFKGTGSIGGAEIELHLRMTMVPGSPDKVFTYEIDVIPAQREIVIVRWNGPQGNFTSLSSGPISGINDGDVIEATIAGPANAVQITVTLNGVTIVTATDVAGYATGSPGMGFDAGTPANGANFGIKSYSATSF